MARQKPQMTPEERAYWDEWLKKPVSEIKANALKYWENKPMRGLTWRVERKGGWGGKI